MDLMQEIAEVSKQLNKKQPEVNQVKRMLVEPKGDEEWLVNQLNLDKDAVVLDLAKFMTGKRKVSTQNRLRRMKSAKLVELALSSGYIRNIKNV